MRTGIYKITNIKNNKCYIGQSKNIDKRFKQHKIYSPNVKMDKDIQKYGRESFKYEILELCKIDELNEKELYYSNLYNSIQNGYNVKKCGNSKKPLEKEKIIKSIFVDEEIFKQFRLYTIMINSSVSKELENYMKETLKKINKKG